MGTGMSDETVEIGESVGDDGLTDDERRVKKMQDKIDEDGDRERARAERANGESPGARGRNAPPADVDKPVEPLEPHDDKGDAATGRSEPVKRTGTRANSK